MKPMIRFKEFNNAWEKRRLDSLVKIITGGTPRTTNKGYWYPKEIPWLSSGEIHKYRIKNTNDMISKKGLEHSNAKWIKENSVLIALAGQGKTRGSVAINEIKLTTNQSIAALIPNNEIITEFLFQNFKYRYQEIRSLSSDGRGGLNKNILKNIDIVIASLEEQCIIGQFLKNIDTLISLYERKLELIGLIKKGCLENMFI